MKREHGADIQGVITYKRISYIDQRGSLTETVRIDELLVGIQPVMSYISFTKPGGSRGPHEHKEQTDIFSFIGPGNFLICLWDNREKSSTRGNYMEIIAGENNPLTLVVPPGVVHGYKNISNRIQGMVINYPDQLYKGWLKSDEVDEIRYEDESDCQFRMEG